MNILYLGPYRQYDYIGQNSRISLHRIKEKLSYHNYKTYSRPVYIDPQSSDNQIPSYLSDDEVFPDSPIEWRGIIQYLPVEFLSAQSFTKNIAIPIFNNQLLKSSLNNPSFKTLNLFDHILVDNDNNKTLLIKSGITTKIHVYNQEIQANYFGDELSGKQFDLGVLNENTIFSFIGSYEANEQVVHKLIIAFLVAFRGASDKTLFLLLKGNSKDKQKIEAFYKQTKDQLRLIEADPVLFSFSSLGLQEAIAALNTCSCYLSINNDVSCTMYEKYAQSLSKIIINKQSLEISQTPILSIGNLYDIEDIVGSINTSSLINKLQSITTDTAKTKNKSNNKSISEILCDILQ